MIRDRYRRFAARHLAVSGPGPHQGLTGIYACWLNWQTRWWPVQGILGRSWGHAARPATDEDRAADIQSGHRCEWWFCRRWPDYEIRFQMHSHGLEVEEAVLPCAPHARRYAGHRGFRIGERTR
jgi:hypothetical protein